MPRRLLSAPQDHNGSLDRADKVAWYTFELSDGEIVRALIKAKPNVDIERTRRIQLCLIRHQASQFFIVEFEVARCA